MKGNLMKKGTGLIVLGSLLWTPIIIIIAICLVKLLLVIPVWVRFLKEVSTAVGLFILMVVIPACGGFLIERGLNMNRENPKQ